MTVDQPSYNGHAADAPIPPEQHIRNEGGSDGAGLCVISSLIINGHWQEVPGLTLASAPTSAAAKARPGGYSPDKLERLLSEVMPGEKYASYVGTDRNVLDALAQGYPVGVTMNTGALYGYRPIHHMVSLIHYRINGYACVVDNNDPGKFHWMPAAEFDRRWIDGGTGWAFTSTRLRASARGHFLLLAALAAALLGVGPDRPHPRPDGGADPIKTIAILAGSASARRRPTRPAPCSRPPTAAPSSAGWTAG